MIGVDTNILVRLLTNDDKIQAKQAANLIEHNTIFITKSVLLETEWVLRYTYDFESDVILDAFKKLLGLAQVSVEDATSITQALQWYSHAIDFADALHLASNQKTKKFATFDKHFIRKAKRLHIDAVFINLS